MAIINLGEVLIEDHPEKVLKQLDGKVWKKVIEKDELPKYTANYKLISSRLYMGKTMIHAFADDLTADGFVNIASDLEDAYFYHINKLNEKVNVNTDTTQPVDSQ
jgi:hypothetical protein